MLLALGTDLKDMHSYWSMRVDLRLPKSAKAFIQRATVLSPVAAVHHALHAIHRAPDVTDASDRTFRHQPLQVGVVSPEGLRRFPVRLCVCAVFGLCVHANFISRKLLRFVVFSRSLRASEWLRLRLASWVSRIITVE